MLRSLYSGISGMKVNQIKMDVIGNNIANVGTTGFKSGRVRFQDMLSQSVTEAMAPMANQGGVNSSQVGLGVQVAGIDTIVKQGMMQPTSRNLDVAIDGDGFFMVGKGPFIFGDDALMVNHLPGTHNVDTNSITKSNIELMYSRDGSFTLDNDGNLLTSDGYRVLGYSLTNDDTRTSATSVNPNNVSTAGLDFRFGPGSALNGYKITIGKVGPGTITSAQVDTSKKWIVLNGDFSKPNAFTDKQAETAINKALNVAGIAQVVNVSGKPMVINNIYSTQVKGGGDSASPNNVSVAGFNIGFTEGSALNGYRVELGKVGTGTETTATVDTNKKKIILNGNFITPNAVSTGAVKNAINSALSSVGIAQTVNYISGSAINLGDISAKTDAKGSVPVVPTLSSPALGGLDFTFSAGGQLNGYTVKLGNTSAGTTTSIDLDKNAKTITINGDFATFPPVDGFDSFKENLKTKFNAKLAEANITQPQLVSVDGTTLTAAAGNFTITAGSDKASPSDISVGGLNFSFNNGKTFNGFTVELVDIGANTPLDVKIDIDAKKVKVSGDFITPNAFSIADLQAKVDEAVANPEKGAFVPGDAEPSGTYKISVTGSPRNYSGVTSQTIEGGSNLAKPDPISVAGLTFNFTAGAKLNDYTIEIGKITEGTKVGAEIDEQSKKIIINGDFTTTNAISPDVIQTAINNALSNKGIEQALSVTGTPININNIMSNATNGGTPIQSIDTDGVINFVDGTKQLNAYDNSLKTMRIPDKIRIKGEDRELRVRTFTISKEGLVNAVLEDGRVSTVGQIAMASFKNPAGLTKLGKNLYSQSVNSGEATLKSGVGTMGEDNSKGYGDVLQGMLEMSNVDLAEQFTDMIVTSRSFQASGKMISTGDEILQDIINLKR